MDRENRNVILSPFHTVPQNVIFSCNFITNSPEKKNRKRNEQHQILNALCCKLPAPIFRILPDPPVSKNIRKRIHPHITVQQSTEQYHSRIKRKKKQFPEKTDPHENISTRQKKPPLIPFHQSRYDKQTDKKTKPVLKGLQKTRRADTVQSVHSL